MSMMAGLSTCVGASAAFLVADDGGGGDVAAAEGEDEDRRGSGRAGGVGPELFVFSLALAASVMITVCVVSIIPECLSMNSDAEIGDVGSLSVLGHTVPYGLLLHRAAGFSTGWAVYVLLSQLLALLPEQAEWSGLLISDLPDHGSSTDSSTTPENGSSWRLTILLFLSLLIHNFPEGLAVQPSQQSAIASTSPHVTSLASIFTLNIALHNIPEGIAIAIPCMAARPDQPFLAFALASLSGLAEPVGVFVGLTLMRLRGPHDVGAQLDMGNALAFVAGIMLAVAICELLPESNQQRRDCDSLDSFMLGIVTGV
ncbi:hypothetical protein ACHAWF_013983 [Thalassiosira exigua]